MREASTMLQRGMCIWLTGRSGAGKTTLTRALVPLLEGTGRTVTVLDTVPELAKQPGERTSQEKLLRKAYVASEIVRHGGIVVCVTVSARRAVREAARAKVGQEGFLEVFVDVAPEVSAARKASRGRQVPVHKHLRRLARRLRAGLGPAAPDYEVPEAPDVVVDAVHASPEEGARAILDALVRRGVLDAVAEPGSGRPA